MSLISKKICPECGSEDVALVEPNSGLWMCKECQYTGHHFIEKEIIGRKMEGSESVKKSNKINKVGRRK